MGEEDGSEGGNVGDGVTKVTVIIWAWFGCDEDSGLWGGWFGYPPHVLVKDMMVQWDHSAFSGAHGGDGDIIMAEDSTQLLANESRAEGAGVVHGATCLLLVLLVVGALLALVTLVTPVMALRAA